MCTPTNDHDNPVMTVTRRELFGRAGSGIGAIALASLLKEDLFSIEPPSALPLRQTQGPLAPKQPHFVPKARNIIFLHMVGAPSQLDLLEYKPELQKYDGKPCPEQLLDGQRFAFLRGELKLMGARFKFAKHGQSGMEISELLPSLAEVADQIAVIKSLYTEQFNHAPAQLFFHTGFERFGRPSLGSWVSYGLGSENQNLPGFVVLITGQIAGAGNSLWGSGFLPTAHQGVEFRSQGDPVLFLTNPPGISPAERGRIIESINHLNQVQLADVGDPEIATRIAQYELAYRMQMSVPELMDVSQEPKRILEMYGAVPGEPSFANNCLLARRLVERGVRFVQLYDQGWDHHGSIIDRLPKKCRQVDKPMAALVKDLQSRGLLEETLVVWGGEFGRTPMLQGKNNNGQVQKKAGRDHHKDAFCVWMAGGGVRPGTVYGRTDELGYHIVEDPMHVNDFHATILHLLGIDHERLTFKIQGRQFRLTDVAGKVAEKLLA